MATYAKLSLGAGGGIIDRRKQSKQEGDAHVIFALGGTGGDVAKETKKKVYKRIRSDDPDAAIPRYDRIKFLILDTDDRIIKQQSGAVDDIDENTEFCRELSNANIAAVFAARNVLANRPELSWLNLDIKIDTARFGAGGIRQVGRFLLIDKAQAIYEKIKSVIQQALVGCTGQLVIHVCSGISGGTGSGTFLDVCYMIRDILQTIGRSNAFVCGYFFLPDVNLTVPAVANDPLTSSYVQVNGYAAIKELDYCMNFGQNNDSFKANYGFKMIDIAQKPVDLCFLISATREDGTVVKNGYQYAINVVADFITDYIASIRLPQGVAPSTGTITFNGLVPNLALKKQQVKLRHGANVEYNLLGGAVAEIPLTEVATYLGAKLFEAYGDYSKNEPTEKERNDFMTKIQVRDFDIFRIIKKGCVERMKLPSRLKLETLKKQDNHRFVEFADEYLAKNNGILETNLKTCTEELGDYDISHQGTSLISKTFKGLFDEYGKKLEYGPFYIKRMLYGSNNHNMVRMLDGYIKKNSGLLEAEARQYQLRHDEYEEAKSDWESRNYFNERWRFRAYKKALCRLYEHYYKVELYRTMGYALEKFKEQLISLSNNYFAILTEVLNTLNATFAENIRYFDGGNAGNASGYNWKIVSISEIRNDLDQYVKQKGSVQQLFYDMMDGMYKNAEKWLGNDDDEIARLISEFILDKFKDETKKTINDYLKLKFKAPSVGVLQNEISKEIFQKYLEASSQPLFWKNSMYNNPVGSMCNTTVPYDAQDVIGAANLFTNGKPEFDIRPSEIADKISMMRFISGLPLYAYQTIFTYEQAYEAGRAPGRHLHERDVDWNTYLPSPIPESFQVSMPIERIVKRNEGLKVIFNQAKEMGIVFEDPEVQNELFIRVTKPFDAEEYVNSAGSYKGENGKTDLYKLRSIIQGLEDKKAELLKRENVSKEMIRHMEAMTGNEHQVILDFYLESPVLNNLVKTEIEKFSSIEKHLQELNEELQKGLNGMRDQFLMAVFTGVITYTHKMTFTDKETGQTIELQNSGMPMGRSGAFQGFKTYQQLPKKTLDKITKLTNHKMNGDSLKEVKAEVQKLEAEMPKRIEGYMQHYHEGNELHAEVEAFYEGFMNELSAFKKSVL